MTKKISDSSIRAAIVEEALRRKEKIELYESAKNINNRLAQLNEVNWVGTFGFKGASDNSSKTKTGFVNDFQNISHIAELEKEMQEETSNQIQEDTIDEVTKLKEELEALKKENEELKSKK